LFVCNELIYLSSRSCGSISVVQEIHCSYGTQRFVPGTMVVQFHPVPALSVNVGAYSCAFIGMKNKGQDTRCRCVITFAEGVYTSKASADVLNSHKPVHALRMCECYFALMAVLHSPSSDVRSVLLLMLILTSAFHAHVFLRVKVSQSNLLVYCIVSHLPR
jgi:hypothetical protein